MKREEGGGGVGRKEGKKKREKARRKTKQNKFETQANKRHR